MQKSDMFHNPIRCQTATTSAREILMEMKLYMKTLYAVSRSISSMELAPDIMPPRVSENMQRAVCCMTCVRNIWNCGTRFLL
ncbi:hypothetical protein M8J76_006334 [Diaphorina citri]|nr:hypothetical protein M8J75_007962 [Diaphorina citri]KAI5732981.1 hypothetical protein M8J76_006334 [Diaphorina citri]